MSYWRCRRSWDLDFLIWILEYLGLLRRDLTRAQFHLRELLNPMFYCISRSSFHFTYGACKRRTVSTRMCIFCDTKHADLRLLTLFFQVTFHRRAKTHALRFQVPLASKSSFLCLRRYLVGRAWFITKQDGYELASLIFAVHVHKARQCSQAYSNSTTTSENICICNLQETITIDAEVDIYLTYILYV